MYVSLTGLFEWAAVQAVDYSSTKREAHDPKNPDDDDEVDIFTLTATLWMIQRACLSAFWIT
jgi:hypothetical protein